MGKTTVCKKLFSSIEGCAWLDADWCWMINPWSPKTTGQKRFTEETIFRILRGYLENKAIDIVFLSWVIKKPAIFESITDSLKDIDFDLYKFALVCDPGIHRARMKSDGRRKEQINSSDSGSGFLQLGAEVIDVSYLTPEETATKIKGMIGEGERGFAEK